MKGLITLFLVLLSLTSSAQFFVPNQTVSATTNPGTGNVGIGNSTPTFKLDVTGNLRTTSFASFREYLTVDNGGSYRVALNAQTDGYITARNSIGEDKFVITTNGNSFFNGGKVGVGTDDPLTLLNILKGAGDATTGTAALRIGGTNNYPSLEFGIKGGYDGMISTFGNDLHIYAGNWRTAGSTASENHNISFYTSQVNSTNWNTPKMYLKSDGNLGIGTSSPTGKLYIFNNETFNTNETAVNQDHIVLNANDPGNGGYFGGITWESAGRRRASIAATRENADADFVGLAFFTKGIDGSGPMFESMRISRDGNVGIGTSSPQYALDIQTATDSYAQLRVKSPGSPLIKFSGSYNAGNGAELWQNAEGDFLVNTKGDMNAMIIKSGGRMGLGTMNPDGKLDINHAGGQLRLSGGTVAGGVWTSHSDVLYLADWNTGSKGLNLNLTSGNVGIGVNNPDTKLAVDGTVRCEEVKVEIIAGTGPDYVFEPDYNLPSLAEIETYIKANKHLPEVPSAKEMETNGINLSEMNMLLLKKIEELTLHMIELKKENEKQNEVIKTLLNK